MSEGKLEKIDKGFNAVKSILAGIIMIAIGAGVIVILINAFSNNKVDDGHISIEEAQKKCTVMEAVDSRKYNNAGADVWELAQKHCLAEWDRSINPENTDEKFIEIIEADWESRKNEQIEGQTIEELYNEVKDNI